MKEIGDTERDRLKEEMTVGAFVGWQSYLVHWENPKKTPMSFHKWLVMHGLADKPTLKVRQEELDEDRRRAFAMLDRVLKAPGFQEAVEPPIGTVFQVTL